MLNGLAILGIEIEMIEHVDVDTIRSDSMFRNGRKNRFI